jgi:hypothetical protein
MEMEKYREEVRTKPESRIKREGDGDGRGREGDGGDVEKKIRTKPEKTTSERKQRNP